MRRLYQKIDPNKNIGIKSGKEFAIFMEEGKMYALHKDGEVMHVSDRDDTPLLEWAITDGTIKIINEKDFLNESINN